MASVMSRMELLLADHPARAQSRHVRTTWTYTSEQPFTVRAVFHVEDADVTWVFARDLLLDGLMGDSGVGDVRIRPLTGSPGQEHVAIELRSPSGQVILLAERDQLADFVRQTLTVVPAGHEDHHLDVDAWILEMLRT